MQYPIKNHAEMGMNALNSAARTASGMDRQRPEKKTTVGDVATGAANSYVLYKQGKQLFDGKDAAKAKPPTATNTTPGHLPPVDNPEGIETALNMGEKQAVSGPAKIPVPQTPIPATEPVTGVGQLPALNGAAETAALTGSAAEGVTMAEGALAATEGAEGVAALESAMMMGETAAVAEGVAATTAVAGEVAATGALAAEGAAAATGLAAAMPIIAPVVAGLAVGSLLFG